jgi:two-component system response regulator (stage 0 sporulation protein A)
MMMTTNTDFARKFIVVSGQEDTIYDTPKATSKKNYARTSAILRCLGIGFHMRGYAYIKQAVEMMLEDPTYATGITKRLYPDLGRLFCTNDKCIERAIRFAISRMNCSDDVKTSLFGYAEESYTNKEFLATIAEILRLENESK